MLVAVHQESIIIVHGAVNSSGNTGGVFAYFANFAAEVDEVVARYAKFLDLKPMVRHECPESMYLLVTYSSVREVLE